MAYKSNPDVPGGDQDPTTMPGGAPVTEDDDQQQDPTTMPGGRHI